MSVKKPIPVNQTRLPDGQGMRGVKTLRFLVILAGILVALSVTIDPVLVQWSKVIDPAIVGFFRAVTVLGQSEWILVPSGVIALVAFFVARGRRFSWTNRAQAIRAMYGAGFFYVAIAGSGIAAQIIKNVVGRPRPRVLESAQSMEFLPFQFNYLYQSFPSGHATTAFGFAAALSLFRPRLRVVIYIVAVLIALSRVIVNAHFFSDVVAGAVLGIVVTFFLQRIFASKRWVFEYDTDGEIVFRSQTKQASGSTK